MLLVRPQRASLGRFLFRSLAWLTAAAVRRGRRCWISAVVVGIAGAGSLAGASNQRWLKVASPEFTVITTMSEKEATAWAGHFAQFVAALHDFIPVDLKRLPPLTLVVFARERDFAPFRPRRANGSAVELAGFFSRRPSWAVAGVGGATMSGTTSSTVFHEGTHWFLSAFELPNPVWLEEGLAEVFSTFTVDRKGVSWGRAIEDHVRVLQLTPLLPLEQLMFLSRDALHGEGDLAALHTGIAYAQSWTFVHYLTFGQRDVPKGALMDYVRRLRTGHPDEAFRQAFGGTYAEIGRKLADYLRGGRYYVATQPLAQLPPLAAEPATAAEVADALSRLHLAAGNHGDARQQVERRVAAAPDDPRSHVLAGELAQEMENPDAALRSFRLAVEKGANDFRPYFEIASAEHRAARSDDGSVGGLPPEKARLVANLYEKAINLNPRFRPSYQGLAGVVELLPPGAGEEDAKFLAQGVRLFTDDGMIRLGLATLARRNGRPEVARQLLDQVLKTEIPQPPHVTAYARRLDLAWTRADVFERIDALAKERKFGEALDVLDEQMKGALDFSTRQALQLRRGGLVISHLLEQARAAMVERRYDDAEALYRQLLESNASPTLKTQVRRQLEQLERRPKKNRP